MLKIILWKLKQWLERAEVEYAEDQIKKMQEVQEANNSDLKEWYISEWEVPKMYEFKLVSPHKIPGVYYEHIEGFEEIQKKQNKSNRKDKNQTNKKTKKSTLEDI